MDRISPPSRSFPPLQSIPRLPRRLRLSLALIPCLLLPAVALGRGWLGVSVQDITPELREAMEIEARSGALVSDVSEGGPAETAGIEPRDVILRVDGSPVEDTGDLLAILREKSPADRVEILVLRGNVERKLEALLGEPGAGAGPTTEERIEREFRDEPFAEGIPPNLDWAPGRYEGLQLLRRGPQLGVSVHSLDEDLASYFDAREGEGVLVLRVEPDSPADRAGIRGGDLLIKINRRSIGSPEDLRGVIRELGPGDDWVIQGRRHGRDLEFRGRIERNSDWPSEPGRLQRLMPRADRARSSASELERMVQRLERQIERLRDRIEDLEGRYSRREGR